MKLLNCKWILTWCQFCCKVAIDDLSLCYFDIKLPQVHLIEIFLFFLLLGLFHSFTDFLVKATELSSDLIHFLNFSFLCDNIICLGVSLALPKPSNNLFHIFQPTPTKDTTYLLSTELEILRTDNLES